MQIPFSVAVRAVTQSEGEAGSGWSLESALRAAPTSEIRDCTHRDGDPGYGDVYDSRSGGFASILRFAKSRSFPQR